MKSRYIRTYQRKLRKHRPSQRIFGSFEDSGRWYRCWNCGFQFDISKIATGSGSGRSSEDFPVEDVNDDYNHLLSMSGSGILLELGPDGGPITSYYTPRKALVIGGCPFCGCMNQP